MASGSTGYQGALHSGSTHGHRHHVTHLHSGIEPHEALPHHHSNVVYATMRSDQRPNIVPNAQGCLASAQESAFQDFVPPPPPMFENGGENSCTENVQPIVSTSSSSELNHKKAPKGSCRTNGSRPVVAPKPKVDRKGSGKGTEKPKRESAV